MRKLMIFAALCALVGCEADQRANFNHCMYYARGTSGGVVPPETIDACRRAAEPFQKRKEPTNGN